VFDARLLLRVVRLVLAGHVAIPLPCRRLPEIQRRISMTPRRINVARVKEFRARDMPRPAPTGRARSG
jgi:hypothetical protein